MKTMMIAALLALALTTAAATGNLSYIVICNVPTTFDGAQQYCMAQGGKLAQISTAAEYFELGKAAEAADKSACPNVRAFRVDGVWVDDKDTYSTKMIFEGPGSESTALLEATLMNIQTMEDGKWADYVDTSAGMNLLLDWDEPGMQSIPQESEYLGYICEVPTCVGGSVFTSQESCEAVCTDSCVMSGCWTCTGAIVVGDPHFVGFNGLAFDYYGQPGAVFSVVSTPTVGVQAQLVPEMINGLTYMGAIGITTPLARIAVKALPENKSLLVEVDDVVIDGSIDLGGVTVTRNSAQVVQVEVANVISLTLTMRHDQFVDLDRVALLMTPTADNIHGVLGQTAIPDRATIAGFEGEEEEYFASGLFNMDSARDVTVADATISRQMGSAVADTVLSGAMVNFDM